MAVEKIYPVSYAYVYSDVLLNKYKLSIGDFNKENNGIRFALCMQKLLIC